MSKGNSRSQEKIETWEEFKERLREFLHSLPNWEEYQEAKRSLDDKIYEDRKALVRAFLRGAEDEIEERLRQEQVMILNLSYAKFSNHGDVISGKIPYAEKIDRNSILKKIEDEEKEREEKRRMMNGLAPEPKKTEAPRKRLRKKINLLPITERGICMLSHQVIMRPEEVEVKGPWNADTKMILDYLAYQITSARLGNNGNGDGEQEPLFNDSEELDRYSDHLISLKERNSRNFENEVYQCAVSTKFGPLMIFLKRWFAYNETLRGDVRDIPRPLEGC